jgi:hypothetical protein
MKANLNVSDMIIRQYIFGGRGFLEGNSDR